MPGKYTVVLTANGQTYSQPLTVKMDPRVKTPAAGLDQQFQLSQRLYGRLQALAPAVAQAVALHKQLQDVRHKLGEGTLAAAVDQIDHKVQAVAGGTSRRPGAGTEPPTLGAMRTRYLALFNALQEADVAPTTQMATAAGDLEQKLPPLMAQWQSIQSQDLVELNRQLKSSKLPEIKIQAAGGAAQATASSLDKDEQ
jgi:hypothetical protein